MGEMSERYGWEALYQLSDYAFLGKWRNQWEMLCTSNDGFVKERDRDRWL